MRMSLKLAAIAALAGSVACIQSPQAMDHGSPGSNAVNNVGAGVAAVTPSAAQPTTAGTATSASTATNAGIASNAGTSGTARASSTMAMQSDMNFSPSMYKTQTDCLNAAAAAHASLNSCKGVSAKK